VGQCELRLAGAYDSSTQLRRAQTRWLRVPATQVSPLMTMRATGASATQAAKTTATATTQRKQQLHGPAQQQARKITLELKGREEGERRRMRPTQIGLSQTGICLASLLAALCCWRVGGGSAHVLPSRILQALGVLRKGLRGGPSLAPGNGLSCTKLSCFAQRASIRSK